MIILYVYCSTTIIWRHAYGKRSLMMIKYNHTMFKAKR